MNPKTRKFARILLQVIVMIALIGALLWYVGIESLFQIITQVKIEYLVLAFLAYFGINLLFTVRLRRVLGREGIKTSFGKTLLAQYAGMLTSDITPGKSGYILMPVYLKDQGVPAPISLSSVLGIQSIDFLAKVLGGTLALVFLVQNSVVPLTTSDFVIISMGIGLMLTGALLLAAMSWSRRVISLVERIANHRLLVRFTGGLLGKLEEYADNARKTRKAFPEIIAISAIVWVIKGFEWYFLGLALGITQMGGLTSPLVLWLGFFLLHPLVTAMGFIPLTPSGIGFQEGAIVGVFLLLGIDVNVALAFALLSRVLVITENLIGVPQIAKSTSSLVFSRKKPKEAPLSNTTPV